MATKGQIVREWRLAKGLKAADVGKLAGTSRQNIENFEKDEVDFPRYLPRLAKAMGYARTDDLLALKPPPGKSPEGVHSPERPRTGGSDAHFVSQLTPTIDPITITWESILSMFTQLPPLFKLALGDGALAPDYPAGTLFVWSTTKQPRIGSVVLVLDAFKQPHARRHAQGRAPGQWVAEATGAGFLPFDGADVTLLAVADEERRQMP